MRVSVKRVVFDSTFGANPEQTEIDASYGYAVRAALLKQYMCAREGKEAIDHIYSDCV